MPSAPNRSGVAGRILTIRGTLGGCKARPGESRFEWGASLIGRAGLGVVKYPLTYPLWILALSMAFNGIVIFVFAKQSISLTHCKLLEDQEWVCSHVPAQCLTHCKCSEDICWATKSWVFYILPTWDFARFSLSDKAQDLKSTRVHLTSKLGLLTHGSRGTHTMGNCGTSRWETGWACCRIWDCAGQF